MTAAPPGLIVAAPASGSGKTVVTLGLLRALARRGLRVASAKVGPDYIDPAFHAAASGRSAATLDGWAMRPMTLDRHIAATGAEADLVLCEGVMGLFDGAGIADDRADGSTAALAAHAGWPVVLVVDVRGMAASVAAVVAGFARLRPDVQVAGAILNRAAGERHGAMMAAALARHCPDVAVLGALPRTDDLAVPSRHLGLVQAGEHPDLDGFLDRAAARMATHLDLDRLIALARPTRISPPAAPLGPSPMLPPLGDTIAVARDDAFAFAYPAVLADWRRAGAALSFFSPLADQAPPASATAIYLPGGYPELHAGRLAAARTFLDGLRRAAARGAVLYGECGGYMTLGRGLVDGQGQRHALAGLLPVETSFAQPRLHLGYREARLIADGPLGGAGTVFRGHEFHYAATVAREGAALFALADAGGRPIAADGARLGTVMGSFLHLIDRQ